MEMVIAGYGCIAFSVWLFWRAINYLGLVRVIEDTPNTNIASTPQGMVEVKGKTLALGNQVLMVPRKNIPCVWYRHVQTYEYEDDEFPDPDTIESHERFYIKDHTGKCAVDPIRADIHPKKSFEEYQDGFRHEVSWIGVDDYVYVLGWMQTLHPEQKTDDVVMIREGKEYRYGQLTDKLDRITVPPHNWLPFIISTHFEHELVKRYRSLFISWAIGGIIVFASGGMIISR
jgi:hypothetical protein